MFKSRGFKTDEWYPSSKEDILTSGDIQSHLHVRHGGRRYVRCERPKKVGEGMIHALAQDSRATLKIYPPLGRKPPEANGRVLSKEAPGQDPEWLDQTALSWHLRNGSVKDRPRQYLKCTTILQ